MSRGRHHVYSKLPDGIHVCADYREKVVPAMRRYNNDVVVMHRDPRPADVAAIRQWWEAHAIMSTNCKRGVCDHEVV